MQIGKYILSEEVYCVNKDLPVFRIFLCNALLFFVYCGAVVDIQTEKPMRIRLIPHRLLLIFIFPFITITDYGVNADSKIIGKTTKRCDVRLSFFSFIS